MQRPQEKQRAASASACSASRPSWTSAWPRSRSAGSRWDVSGARCMRVVEGVDRATSGSAGRPLRATAAAVRLQPPVDLARRAPAHADRLGDEARRARHVAARKHALGAGRAAGIGPEERAVGARERLHAASSGSCPIAGTTASAVSVNSLPAIGVTRNSPCRGPGSKCTRTQSSATPSEVRARRAQEGAVDEHDAFLQRLQHFLALRRHLRFALERDQAHFASGAPRAARDVDRGAAAADHREARAERGRRAGVRLREVGGARPSPRARRSRAARAASGGARPWPDTPRRIRRAAARTCAPSRRVTPRAPRCRVRARARSRRRAPRAAAGRAECRRAAGRRAPAALRRSSPRSRGAAAGRRPTGPEGPPPTTAMRSGRATGAGGWRQPSASARSPTWRSSAQTASGAS